MHCLRPSAGAIHMYNTVMRCIVHDGLLIVVAKSIWAIAADQQPLATRQSFFALLYCMS